MAFASSRRRVLRAAAAAAIAPSLLARAASTAAKSITVAQIVDVSTAQQDVSKDMLIGSRAAWQDINAKGGIHGWQIKHTTFDVDGTAASLQAAVRSAVQDPVCVAISATAGERAALEVVNQLRGLNAPIAHVAPWLQNSNVDIDERTFPIFAARQEQLSHSLRVLTEQGVQEVGLIFATDTEYKLYRDEFDRIGQNLKFKMRNFPPLGEVAQIGRKLTPDTPAILVFVGGTPEIISFMQGMEAQQRQRYLVALADVNLQTLNQLGGNRKTPVIGTQVVPVLSSPVNVVRQYRAVLGKFFDEPPTPLSLAGFIAARYTADVLEGINGVPTRPNVLAAFQRRELMDVGGFRVSYSPQRRSAGFVAQSMLTADGRMIS